MIKSYCSNYDAITDGLRVPEGIMCSHCYCKCKTVEEKPWLPTDEEIDDYWKRRDTNEHRYH